MADQYCQINALEVCDPKPPERMRLIDVMTRLGGGVRNRVQTCRRTEHTPTRLTIPIDAVNDSTVSGRVVNESTSSR